MNKIIKKAFTLIELLVVIAIIGILSGMIVITMGGATQKATIAKAQVFSNSLRNSLMIDMIAEYKRDSNASDTWGNHTAGTISGAVAYSSCIQNTCYSFDNVDDYIELPDSADLRMTTGGTISLWIYPKSSGEGGFGRLIDKGIDISSTNGYAIYLGPNNRIGTNINAASEFYSSDNSISFNQWQLATLTTSTSGRKLYINGIKVGESSVNILPPNIAGVIAIGNRAGSASMDRTFNGYIDEVRIYDTIITASQIKEQYYAGLNSLLASGQISKEEYQNRLVGAK